jgi:hypothetical protein
MNARQAGNRHGPEVARGIGCGLWRVGYYTISCTDRRFRGNGAVDSISPKPDLSADTECLA